MIANVTCTRCGDSYPATTEYFSPCVKKLNGLQSRCKECYREIARERMRERRADSVKRAKVLAEKQRHAQSPLGQYTKRRYTQADNHRARAERKGLPVLWSVALWEQCQRAWWYCCAYCGEYSDILVHDHVIPLHSPQCPGTVPWNIVPACPACNKRKHTKSIEQFCENSETLDRVREYLEVRRGLHNH